MHHFTYWTLLVSRIKRAWLYKGHEDSDWQLTVDLAQLVTYWPEDLEVLVSRPQWGQFCQICFNLPCVKICQIIWQKRLLWRTRLTLWISRNQFWRTWTWRSHLCLWHGVLMQRKDLNGITEYESDTRRPQIQCILCIPLMAPGSQ